MIFSKNSDKKKNKKKNKKNDKENESIIQKIVEEFEIAERIQNESEKSEDELSENKEKTKNENKSKQQIKTTKETKKTNKTKKNKDNDDSYDVLNDNFSNKLRELKKQKAYLSIFLLAEQYISITRSFFIDSDEYTYFLEKYKNSSESENDLTQSEIVLYLKNLIERLQNITNSKFDPEIVEKFAPRIPEDDIEQEQKEEQKEDQKEEHKEEQKEEHNQKPNHESPEKIQEIKEIHATSVEKNETGSLNEKLLEKQLENYPDLKEILKETMKDESQFIVEKVTISKQTIKPLKSFSFLKKVPKFKKKKGKKEKNI